MPPPVNRKSCAGRLVDMCSQGVAKSFNSSCRLPSSLAFQSARLNSTGAPPARGQAEQAIILLFHGLVGVRLGVGGIQPLQFLHVRVDRFAGAGAAGEQDGNDRQEYQWLVQHQQQEGQGQYRAAETEARAHESAPHEEQGDKGILPVEEFGQPSTSTRIQIGAIR